MTLQAELFRNKTGKYWHHVTLTPPFSVDVPIENDRHGGHVLGRWTRRFSETSNLSLQAYYDSSSYENFGSPGLRDSVDLELQHRFAVGQRHDLVWGVGYRRHEDRLLASPELTWTPERETLELYNLFVQDEVALTPDRLNLIVGSKFEHHSFTDFEVQPGLRLLFTPTETQTWWASMARAARTPSRLERGGRIHVDAFRASPSGPPVLVALLPNSDASSEQVTAFELGWRIEPRPRVSFDATTYFHRYDRLFTYVAEPARFEPTPAPPHVLVPLTGTNVGDGHSYGAELAVQWIAAEHWRLSAGASWLHMHIHPDASVDGTTPGYQAFVRSSLDLPHHLQLNGGLSYVGRLAGGNNTGSVPAHLRLDTGVVWRPSDSFEAGIWGSNLLDDHHPEFTGYSSAVQSEVPRSFTARLTWRY